MTERYEILKKYDALYQFMKAEGFNERDYNNLAIYEEYMRLLQEGGKKAYAEAVLKERYGLGRNTVLRIVARMRADVSPKKRKNVPKFGTRKTGK